MPSHYLKLLPFLQKYATEAGATPSGWSDEIFRDITHGGLSILVKQLESNSDLPRVALFGERFYAEAGRDRGRDDTLFVTRIQKAPTAPQKSAERYEANWRVITSISPATTGLDSIACLFQQTPILQELDDESPSTFTPIAKPGPRLLILLRSCPLGVRSLFRPGVTPDLGPATSYLSAFRAPWNRHRLDTCSPVGVTPRTLGILNGTINPGTLPDNDRTAIASVFGIDLLNRYLATRTQRVDDAVPLLEDLGALPLLESVRATLWSHSIRYLPDSDLRREIHAAIPGLLAAARDKQTNAAYQDALLTSLAATRDARHGAPVIAELIDLASANPDNVLPAIATWASRLEVRCDAPPAVDKSRDATSHTGTEDSAPASASSTALATVGPSVPSVGPGFDRWVLSFRLPDLGVLSGMNAEIAEEISHVHATQQEPVRIGSVLRLLDTLTTLADRIQHWKKQLPSPEELAADEQEARTIYEQARASLGPELDAIISHGVRPEVLRDIAEIMDSRELLAALPDWAWCPQQEMPSNPPAPAPSLWKRLLDPVVRRRALLISQLDKESSELSPRAFVSLPQPTPGTSIDDYIEEHITQLTQFRARLKDIDPLHASWTDIAANSGISLPLVIECLDILDRIRPRLSPETFSAILHAQETHAKDEITLLAQSRAMEKAVRETEKHFGAADEITFTQLRNLINRHRLADSVSAPIQSLCVQHNFSDRSGQRAHLQVADHPGQPWGLILAPLVLETDAAAEVALRFEWTVGQTWRDAWPSDWPGVEPSELRISKLDWRHHSDKPNVFLYSFRLQLPVRKPSPTAPPKRLVVSVSVKTIDGLKDLGTRDLEWTQISPVPKRVRLDWPDTLNPIFVKQHPIGPQRDADNMVERLRSGHSFAVVAPRRFGKSTLVEYLRSLNGQEKLVVPSPIVCTRYAGSSGIDVAEFWKDVSETIRAETGAAIDVFLESALPRSTAFDGPRRAIAEREARTLVILFDEAQALFKRGPDGYHFGDRLKDAIEHFWSRRTDDLAGIAFVFVGLPGLLDRAGSNLVGALRPFQRNDINEDDLNRLLLEVTNGALQTTRGARLRIAQLSKNLLLLRELLERLVALAREDGRTWVSTDDVLAVEADLTRKLREGQEPAITRSLRDVFNEAETVNEWQPSALYPIAAALAEARSEGLRSEADLLRRVVEVLNAWASTAEADYLKRIAFESGKIKESFRSLREAGVLKENEAAFASPLLEAWLFGISRQGVHADETFYPAMLSSAMARVRRPATLTPVDEGGQARLFKFSEGEEVLAYREAAIGSDEDRARFVETVDALDEVRKRVSRRLPGTEYVFDLRAVGLREDDDTCAVQVYRWIDGEDLSSRRGCLPSLAVAELGYQMAQAIAWLHSIGVIHRDLQPKNVILSEEIMRPILIDFGLARLEGRVLKTNIASDFAAPEVRTVRPNWTKAADVWSLGVTLEQLLRKERTDDRLAKVLADMRTVDISKRPTAEALIERFKECVTTLAVQDRKNVFFEEQVTGAIGKDGSSGYYVDVIRKFRPKFEAAYLGLFPSVPVRTAEAADFVNQVVEAWGAERMPRSTVSLGLFKNKNDVTEARLVCKEIDLLHGLRLAKSHGSKRIGQALSKVGVSEHECAKFAVEGARRLAQELGLPSLPKVVQAFFADSSRPS